MRIEGKVTKGAINQIGAAIATAQREIASNAPFVERQFYKHMENLVEKAKVEIEGYATVQAVKGLSVKKIEERNEEGNN